MVLALTQFGKQVGLQQNNTPSDHVGGRACFMGYFVLTFLALDQAE